MRVERSQGPWAGLVWRPEWAGSGDQASGSGTMVEMKRGFPGKAYPFLITLETKRHLV